MDGGGVNGGGRRRGSVVAVESWVGVGVVPDGLGQSEVEGVAVACGVGDLARGDVDAVVLGRSRPSVTASLNVGADEDPAVGAAGAAAGAASRAAATRHGGPHPVCVGARCLDSGRVVCWEDGGWLAWTNRDV